uniref:Uncharacterized protein n=1 Tax=viral metagenome TaxID=1070528 RepID=A0A6M3JM73_9ZZZZ
MIIKYSNTGGRAELDIFMEIETCCYDISTALMVTQQIKISEEGYLRMKLGGKTFKYCPWCKDEIKRVNIND